MEVGVFEVRGLVALIGNYLGPRDYDGLLRHLGQWYSGWLSDSGLNFSVFRHIGEIYPDEFVDALQTFLAGTNVAITGSLVLQHMMLDTLPAPTWIANDMDLFGPLNQQTVAALRTFLDDIKSYLWLIECTNSLPTKTVESAKLLEPINSFQYQGPKRRGNMVAESSGYCRHIPTVCYKLHLIDPKSRDKCVHQYAENANYDVKNKILNDHHHYPVIDVVLIRDTVDDSQDAVSNWIHANFDLDICTSTVFAKGKCRSKVFENIMQREALFDASQYCIDIDVDTLNITRTNRHQYSATLFGHPYCPCSTGVVKRIRKYRDDRKFLITQPQKDPPTKRQKLVS